MLPTCRTSFLFCLSVLQFGIKTSDICPIRQQSCGSFQYPRSHSTPFFYPRSRMMWQSSLFFATPPSCLRDATGVRVLYLLIVGNSMCQTIYYLKNYENGFDWIGWTHGLMQAEDWTGILNNTSENWHV